MARFVDRATGVAMRRGGSAPWTMMLACLLACAAGDFRPSTPREFLKKFNEYSSLQSGRRGVVMSGPEFGTVSSTLLSLPKKTHNSVYHYASGSPAEHAYDDLSALLRQVLSTDKQ